MLFKLMPISLKGTSNCLPEFQNLLKLTQIFLNFLYDIRNILPEINITSPSSFPPGVSQTCWDLTIGLYGKHLTFITFKMGFTIQTKTTSSIVYVSETSVSTSC